MSTKVPVRFLGVALVSLATLVLELTLTRLFSATMFYHFAFLAISLALFGSGASGVALYVARPRLDEARTAQLMAVFSALFGAATVVGLVVILSHPLNPAAPGLGTLASLAWIYGAAALPFFFSGQPLEVIERDSDRDYYLEAKAAVEYGLIDQVLTTPEESKVAR